VDFAIDCPNDVFPTPGGPTNSNIGDLDFFTRD